LGCENACYESIIESCEDITVKAGFSANTNYYWILSKSSSSNIYQRLVTSNGSGDIIILKSDLPPGFLVKGNSYLLKIRLGSNYLQPVLFTFGSKTYGCVLISLVDIVRAEDDDSEVNVIKYLEPVTP
jgi:hypothetical protein